MRKVRRVSHQSGIRALAASWAAATLILCSGAPAQAERPHVGAREGVLRVHLLHTNDIHGYLGAREAGFMNPEFPPALGGAASAAAYIKRVRSEAAVAGEGVLLLDGGDVFQGTRLGESTKGGAIIEWMNEIGYDAMVLGNHDFDVGWENARRLARMAEFPALGANVAIAETGERVAWAEPYTIVETAGVRFGIVGIVTRDTKSLVPADQLGNVDFLPADETVRRYAPEMREKGAEVMVALGHIGVPPGYETRMESVEQKVALSPDEREGGLNAQELVHAVTEIDIMVGGHIHWGLRKPYEDPITHTVCFQTYGRMSGLGHIVLLIDEQTHTFAGYEFAHADGAEVTLFTDYVWPNPEHKQAIGAAVAVAEAGMDEVAGIVEVHLGRGDAEHILGQVVADAFREAAGADVAFTNRGGIRTELRRGPVTPRDLYEVLPFNNELELFEVTGETLREILETGVSGGRRDLELSGAQIRVDQSKPDGQKLDRIEIAGAPIDPAGHYTVVTTSYLAQGSIGWDILPELSSKSIGMNDLEAFLRYIEAHSPIAPHFVPRIDRINQ